MRRRSREVGTRVWVAVAGGLALLSGCTGGPDPAPSTPAAVTTPTVAPTPTPSAPPRPTLPEQPAAMAEPTAEGAEAAARYFFELYEYAFTSGDPAPFRALSADGCTFCGRVVEQVQQAADDDLLTDRDPAEITDLSVVEVRPGEWFTVDMRRRQGEIRLLGSDGSVLQSEPPGQALHYGIALSWSGRWAVDQVGLLEDPQ